MIEMMLLDLSKGFWRAFADYLSCFSIAGVFFIISVLSGMAALFLFLVRREYEKDQNRFR